MTEKKRFLGGGQIGILTLILTFLFAGQSVLAGQQAGPPSTRGSLTGEEKEFKIFSLRHITVDQGKKYLAEVIHGTVTHPFPGQPSLLVTARPGELAKAKILLDLVDEPSQFVIKPILPVSAARSIPSNEQIAARLNPRLTRGVSIGSFSTPPSPDAEIKAIIDIHNDAVVAIAPPSLLDQIVSIIEQQSPNFPEFKEPIKTGTQDKSIDRSERTISHIIEPTEAKFLLSANSETETEPNAVADVQENDAAETSSAGSFQLPPLVNGEQVVNLNLADREKLTIIDFLGLVGPYLKLDFTYKEKDIDQEFTINPHGKYAGPIKVKDLYPMLETVLKNAGLAMTRSSESNLVTITQVANTLDIDPTLLEDDGVVSLDRGDGMIQRVFKLEHIETSAAQALLEGMKLTTDIKEVPETKTLIVTAYAFRMSRIQKLLNVVDRPGEPKKFRFRPLQFTMAETLLPKLQALAEQLGTISITIAEEEESSIPARPKQNPGESAAAYSVRLRQWQARLRSRTTAARGTSTAQQTQQPTTPTVYLDADERTNRILMIGLREQLDEVEELIDTLDMAQQDLRSLELYKIQYVDAEDVKTKLEELGIITPVYTSPYTSRITGDTKAPTTSPTTAARISTATAMRMRQEEMMEMPLDEPQVVVISQINSLLVNATTEQHEKIVKIKEYVDRETDEDEMPVNIYPLENQSPSHLEEVLRPLIEETIMDKEGKAVQEVKKKQPEDQIEIVADPNTFSLIVYASKKNQDWIGKLIKQLDQRRPQVLIDVTLVQISKTDAFNYDLNILSSFPDLTDTSGLTSAIMGGVEGAAATNLVSTLTSSNRDHFVDFQSNSGVGTGFYGDRHINMLLHAMQEKNYGRILAKPKILVNDNETGTISTIDRTYVTKTSSIPVSSAGAGQNATLIETAVDYQDYPAGITLTIVPHISRGNFLRLDITLDRSDFGTITGDKPPDTTESNIGTIVTVPDGSTIILGGLIKLNQSKGGTKVPILGDIPIVGGLFRSTSNSDIQRNLYVFVKAEIIRPPDKEVAQMDEHLDQISQRNREAFEEHEKEFQEYNDWPALKPKTMDPSNVLDAQ